MTLLFLPFLLLLRYSSYGYLPPQLEVFGSNPSAHTLKHTNAGSLRPVLVWLKRDIYLILVFTATTWKLVWTVSGNVFTFLAHIVVEWPLMGLNSFLPPMTSAFFTYWIRIHYFLKLHAARLHFLVFSISPESLHMHEKQFSLLSAEGYRKLELEMQWS